MSEEDSYPRLAIAQPEGTEPTDQIFSHSVQGTYNASLILRLMKAGKIKFIKAKVDINDSWRSGIKEVDVDPAFVDKITLDYARATPCLIIVGPEDDMGFLIDGAHRLKKIIDAGDTEFRALAVDYATAQNYRLRFVEKRSANEEWKEVPSEEMTKMGWGRYWHSSEDLSHWPVLLRARGMSRFWSIYR